MSHPDLPDHLLPLTISISLLKSAGPEVCLLTQNQTKQDIWHIRIPDKLPFPPKCTWYNSSNPPPPPPKTPWAVECQGNPPNTCWNRGKSPQMIPKKNGNWIAGGTPTDHLQERLRRPCPLLNMPGTRMPGGFHRTLLERLEIPPPKDSQTNWQTDRRRDPHWTLAGTVGQIDLIMHNPNKTRSNEERGDTTFSTPGKTRPYLFNVAVCYLCIFFWKNTEIKHYIDVFPSGFILSGIWGISATNKRGEHHVFLHINVIPSVGDSKMIRVGPMSKRGRECPQKKHEAEGSHMPHLEKGKRSIVVLLCFLTCHSTQIFFPWYFIPGGNEIKISEGPREGVPFAKNEWKILSLTRLIDGHFWATF